MRVLLLLSVCLEAAIAQETIAFVDRTTSNWGENENVMRPERRIRCQKSAQAIVDACHLVEIFPNAQETKIAIDVWLRSLKAEVNYKTKYKRAISGVMNRNMVDDALEAVTHIYSHNIYITTGQLTVDRRFQESVGGGYLPMSDIIALVWAVIHHYELFDYTYFDPSSAQELALTKKNMQTTLLRALAEVKEDHGGLICDVGISQRILLPLQGYIDGVQIDSDFQMDNSGTRMQISPQDFIISATTSINGVLDTLNDNFPLKILMTNFALYSNVTKDMVRSELMRVEKTWVDGVKILFPGNDAVSPKISQIFKNYFDLLETVDVDPELGLYTGKFADEMSRMCYHITTASSSEPQQNYYRVAQNAGQPVAGEERHFDGILQMWNGSKWIPLS